MAWNFAEPGLFLTWDEVALSAPIVWSMAASRVQCLGERRPQIHQRWKVNQ